MSDEPTLSVHDAAKLLGVHVKTVRAWADKGLLPVIKWPNGWRRFRRSDLEEVRVRMESAGE
jgi:excisionase family DNA binding protein